MPERSELDYILDITISKREYFCRITNRVLGETYSFSTPKNINAFVARTGRMLYHKESLYRGRLEQEEWFMKYRIRECVLHELDQEYFYAANDAGKPVSVGIFIAWEDEDCET